MLITANFPIWFRAGCYGGLGCSLLVAAGVATYALARKRGTPRQLAGAMLGCLAAAVCILPAIIWSETRLDLQGPALSVSEVLLWLAWVAVIGWMLPLGVSAGFLLLAPPFDARQARLRQANHALQSVPASESNEERQREPLGPGIAWGRLEHLDGPYLHRQVALSRQIVLLGRERDNDILLDTDLASRYHAELRLERGRAYLLDRGSMNGTSVNGQKIWGLAPLHDGDLLEIGGQRFRYGDLRPQAGSARTATPHEGAEGEQTGETAALPAVVAAPPQPVFIGQLMLNGGPGAGQVFALNKAILTIGRSEACDIVIPDASISRQHAQIIRQEMGWYVQDLGSRNGTSRNGQRLSAPQRLEDGDTLTIGNIPLRYLASSPAEENVVAEEPVTETLPAASEASAAAAPTTATPTQALPPKAPTVPLRGRDNPGPLRLPTRPLPPSSGAAESEQEASEAAPTPAQLSNRAFRPRRLVAERAFLAPVNPPADQS